MSRPLRVLVACEFSGAVRDAFLALGHDAMSCDLCGYTVVDRDGTEGPCDLPATGWRWYQDVEHEDTLDAACDLHSNEGGRRIKALEEVWDAANGRVNGLKEFDPIEHPGVALHDVLNVLERRMGADWLNGREGE